MVVVSFVDVMRRAVPSISSFVFSQLETAASVIS